MNTRRDTEIAPELREAITRFVVPLQTTRSVDSAAFEHLQALTVELMHWYKGKDLVSKSLLNEIYTTSRIIQAESVHAKANREVLERMAAKLEMCFGLLLLNETPEDRKPGVPRST
jgi:hypothetical protein